LTIHEGHGVCIAEVFRRGWETPDPEANADLIVRAVNCHEELVDALENLLAWANIHDDGTGKASDQALCVARNARTAIAKAKGGA
jgi:hypothetical protein